MATNIMKTYENHGIVELSKIKATRAAIYILSVLRRTLINGSMVAIGEYEKG